MLKVYRRNIKWRMIPYSGNKGIVKENSDIIICEEEDARNSQIMYPREKIDKYFLCANNIYYSETVFKKKLCIRSYEYLGCCKKFYVDKYNAIQKTVIYTEISVSMNDLMKLPFEKVIAYLKQEGLNIKI